MGPRQMPPWTWPLAAKPRAFPLASLPLLDLSPLRDRSPRAPLRSDEPRTRPRRTRAVDGNNEAGHSVQGTALHPEGGYRNTTWRTRHDTYLSELLRQTSHERSGSPQATSSTFGPASLHDGHDANPCWRRPKQDGLGNDSPPLPIALPNCTHPPPLSAALKLHLADRRDERISRWHSPHRISKKRVVRDGAHPHTRSLGRAGSNVDQRTNAVTRTALVRQ